MQIEGVDEADSVKYDGRYIYVMRREAGSGLRSPDVLRQVRAVELLERLGSREAQDVMKTLAQSAPEARLTQEAKASLERLARLGKK